MEPSAGCSCCSVAKLWPTLCDPMNCSTPDFPVLHCLLQFAQTHVHWIDDAMQPISSSVISFFSCPQSFPGSGSFPMNLFLGAKKRKDYSNLISALSKWQYWHCLSTLFFILKLLLKNNFVFYCAHLCMKCSLDISDFLEETSSLSHSIVFLYFFALIT